jgi:hypothetical protein
MNGVSVAMDETTREVSERQVMPAGGLRERIEQSRPITAYSEGTPFERGTQATTPSNPATARPRLDCRHDRALRQLAA